MRKTRRYFLLILLAVSAVAIGVSQNAFKSRIVRTGESVVHTIAAIPSVAQVLGGWRYGGYNQPRIVISGTKEGYAAGGVVPISSADEPSVLIEGNNISGTADVAIYQADEASLLSYLQHDDEWKQTNKKISTDTFRYVATVSHAISQRGNDDNRLLLPIGENGIWFIRVTLGAVSQDGFVIRSDTGVLVKEGNDELIFWGQDFKTKRSVSRGNVTLYNLKNDKKIIGKSEFNSEGVARVAADPDIDIAIARFGDDFVLIPVNLLYLNSGNYAQFQRKAKISKYFVFTDRPIYKPGDTIYFKAILRRDDDARYAIPEGTATVKVYKDWDEKQAFYEKNITITADGTVFGQAPLPADSETGYYNLNIQIPGQSESSGYYEGGGWATNTVGFQVEFFRKPEYSIDITVPKTDYVAGDSLPVTIQGSYFSGHALSGASVSYTVSSSDFYDYEYLMEREWYGFTDDYRFGSWYGNQENKQYISLNAQGTGTVDIPLKGKYAASKMRVITVEAQYDDGSGNPSFARKNILLYPGLFGIYRKDYNGWGVKTGSEASIALQLVPRYESSLPGHVTLTAKIHRENWVSYQEVGKKYPSYRQETEDLPPITAVSDSEGSVVFRFIPKKSGSYKLTVSGQDSRGNTIEKDFYVWVSSEDQPYYSTQSNSDLTIQSEKSKYAPGETARVTIVSEIPDRDVFLSFDRAWVNRYQIVHMTGKSAVVELPIVATDIPNIFISVSSFSPQYLNENSIDVKIRTDSKQLAVTLKPNKNTYAPGDTAVVSVMTKDVNGNPVSADTAVWAIDKALFELVDEKPEKIFSRFWSDRYNNTHSSHSLVGINVYGAEGGGGCFAAGTRILMADGSEKTIENVKKGDMVRTRKNPTGAQLVSAKVTGVHRAMEPGYLQINSDLKITADHKLFVNNSWKVAGDIQIGDVLTGSTGEQIPVVSVEWMSGKTDVYNLEIETYHTFIADNIWVHNQKGGGARSVFKDTAYWNPSVHTGADGTAQISFKLPDNLTTWVISSIGSTGDTKVGQDKKEIIVTKDIVVRPILPNILRIGDVLRLSAMVHNFTDEDRKFNVALSMDSGKVSQPVYTGISVTKKNLAQLYWEVIPEKQNAASKITVAATAPDDKKINDTVISTVPVKKFGFFDTFAQTGDGDASFSFQLKPDTDLSSTDIVVSLAASQFGLLPQAMQYLVQYPYGCVEQTTSSFVPAVIARTNLDLYADAMKDKKLDEILTKGLKRLAILQKPDGGWTWWYDGNSNPYITAYVTEYLLMAQKTGVPVDDYMLSRAKNYLEQETQFNAGSNPATAQNVRDDRIIKTYALSLFGSPKGKDKLAYFSGKSVDVDVDLLAFAILANVRNGNKDPQSNGLALLLSLMKTQGDSAYWPAGHTTHFGSIDASTSLALRAIIAAGGDRQIAAKAARYLTKNRKNQYWSNTYGTAQVVRAMTDFVRTGNESTPDYSYTVSVDGNQLSGGTVNSIKNAIPDIRIPADTLKKSGSVITVKKSGEGQLYSTLIIKEFRTDSKAKESSKGLTITRSYVNEKGEEYSIGVGDTVTVQLTVSGLSTEQNYAFIEDELPAGMIPVNVSLKNEQMVNGNSWSYGMYDGADKEVTQNGMIMSVYRLGTSSHTYSYKARVIADGTFRAPPATVSLMYSPEIYGRTTSDTVTIVPVSKALPEKVLKKSLEKQVKSFRVDYRDIGYALIGISIGGLLIFIFRKVPVVERINALSAAVFKKLRIKNPHHHPEHDTHTPKTDSG